MNRHATYPQPYHAAPTQRYPSTSSAFSASANPNEDWTKISDLAERRRIQNRIAQRNYRKKLKKRLEDLEKRAASNSASPEQKPVDLAGMGSQKKNTAAQSEKRELHHFSFESRTSQAPSVQYMPFDERNMFSEQYTRQLSTSPPPVMYTGYSSEAMAFTPYSHDLTYPPLTTVDMPIFPAELPPLSNSIPTTLPGMDFQVKHDSFLGSELTPFTLSYASMANIDISAAQSYADSNPHTPPLSECFEQSVAGSPPELSMPTTPPFTHV